MSEDVKPGELITAQLMNQMLSDIKELQGRVSSLEDSIPSGSEVAITGISGTQRLGAELIVAGRNFEVPALLNRVTLAGALIQSFNPGSNDTTLRFNIPVNITDVPRTVPLTITNRNGTATWPNLLILERPGETPLGQMVVTPQPGSPDPLEVGDTRTFVFKLDSQTNIPETYQLQTVITNVFGASADDWRRDSAIVDASDGTGEGAPEIDVIEVDPRSPALVGIRVTVPSGAESVHLALRVSSVNNPSDPQLNVTSDPMVIKIGEIVEESDPRISFSNRIVAPAGRSFSDPLTGDGVESPFGGEETFIRVTAEFELGGTYAYSSSFIPESSGIWSGTILDPEGTTVEVAHSEQNITIRIQMLLEDAPSDDRDEALLEIRVARTDEDDTGQFESWTRIPIRGFT